MKRSRPYIILALGLVAAYVEFFTVKGWDLFGADIISNVPLVLLCILILRFASGDAKIYRGSKRLNSFLPSFIGLAFAIVIFGHIYFRLETAKGETLFKAYTHQLSDEGFYLEFKKNGYVGGVLARKFSEDYFWGTYKKRNDTIFLNVRNNIQLGNTAILTNDTLKMIGDSMYFLISDY